MEFTPSSTGISEQRGMLAPLQSFAPRPSISLASIFLSFWSPGQILGRCRAWILRARCMLCDAIYATRPALDANSSSYSSYGRAVKQLCSASNTNMIVPDFLTDRSVASQLAVLAAIHYCAKRTLAVRVFWLFTLPAPTKANWASEETETWNT